MTALSDTFKSAKLGHHNYCFNVKKILTDPLCLTYWSDNFPIHLVGKIADQFSRESLIMLRTQKKEQYALRAMLELARHCGCGPIKISRIAESQAIPQSYLEVILGQLKGSGFVDSKRGYTGGSYLL